MISNISKVTVYVNSQEEARAFWTDQMGFVVTFEQTMGPGFTWLEVAPNADCQTSLVLYSKALMQQQNPSAITQPSLIFATENPQALWATLKSRGVGVTELITMPYGTMFNFTDNDGNLFMVRG